MSVPCVRVSPKKGEATRRALAELDLIDGGYEITVHDGSLYIPITDPSDLPSRHDVVEFDAPVREVQTTPEDLLDYEPSYERLGGIVLLDEDDTDQAKEIADALIASDFPVDTVLNRASKVEGKHRVRDWIVLAGNGTETVHREYGAEFLIDVAEVYFSPRLATERHRVVKQVTPGEHVFDMFAGVGPFVVPAAMGGATGVGVDLNPTAIRYLRENAARNGVSDRVTAIEGDVREVKGYDGWAERLVMNLPHTADEFLDCAIELAGDNCIIHYYDIQNVDDPFGPGERVVREVAEPEGYDVAVETRREVRSYAPHELNVCLDMRLRKI